MRQKGIYHSSDSPASDSLPNYIYNQSYFLKNRDSEDREMKTAPQRSQSKTLKNSDSITFATIEASRRQHPALKANSDQSETRQNSEDQSERT